MMDRRSLARVADSARAYTGRLPLIEIQGINRIYIENYTKIQFYSQEEITVLAPGERIRISGRGLSFLTVSGDSLLISGTLTDLTFSEDKKP